VKSKAVYKAVSIVLFGLMAAGSVFFSPRIARAQSVEALQKQIEAMQKALDAVRSQLKNVQKEQAKQKTRIAKQEAETAPLKEAAKRISKVSISGGATGTIQSTTGTNAKTDGGDDAFAGGSFDLVFEYKPMKNWKVVLDLEAVGGNGPEQRFSTLHGLNDDLGTTNDAVTILEAYLEGGLFKNRVTLTTGKIDATNYIDGNAFAGDSSSQFLSGSFVNNAVLSTPDNGPGVRVRLDMIPDKLYLETVGMSQDLDANGNTTERIFEDVFGALEVGLTPKLFGRQGNYRVWGTFDGAGTKVRKQPGVENFVAMGAGLSFDQEVADWLGLFFRIAYRDTRNIAYTTRSAWSAGAQLDMKRLLPSRKKDVFGISWGEITPTKRDFGRNAPKEDLLEAYYRWTFNENFHLSGIFQYVHDRNANARLDDVYVFGGRVQANF
jgi:high affinity Mn2+ porin